MSTRTSAAPRAAIGNLRFTDGGVYAEYLVSGMPFVFLSKDVQEGVAAFHTELHRSLPSGAKLDGLTVPVATRQISRRMFAAHPDLHPDNLPDGAPIPPHTRRWIEHCQLWVNALAATRSRRRIHWLSLPLDYGLDGLSATGEWQRRVNAVIGRDKDSDQSLAHYRELAATMVAALPPALFPKPVTVEQIWWHWNYTASRYTFNQPLPNLPYNPDARLDESVFTPVHFDESAAALRERRWRAARTESDVFVRTFRNAEDRIPDSYQVTLGIETWPDSGLRWPESTLFKVCDDLTTPACNLDWSIHYVFESAEKAVDAQHNVILNIRDQARQLGRHALSDDELVRKLASGKQLASAYKRTAERGVYPAVTITAAAASAEAVDAAITPIIRSFRKKNHGMTRRPGSQVTLWRGVNTGTETSSALHEFRSPTTTAEFARFVPLLATRLGNNVGIPIGETIISPGMREVVLNDLVGAPGRDNPANITIGGSPGRGKSSFVKNFELSLHKMGVGQHIMDPTGWEHAKALEIIPDDEKVIFDVKKAKFSLDGLRIFPYEEAAERTVDSLLPQMGFAPLSPQASRLKGLLDPARRDAAGIGSTKGLIRYLADRSRPDRVALDDDLLIALEGLQAERLLYAMFDETLPLPDLSKQLVIWNFGGLELPTITDEYQAHLHHMTTPSQRAAQALYGMAADVARTLFYSRREQPDMLWVEEAAAWTHSPGGQKCANNILRQGRKSWTMWGGISQNPPKDFGILEDEFIEQRICLGFKFSDIAEATLRWCGRDVDRHPKLLADYVTNTSPTQAPNYGDDAIDSRHGKVIPGRHGEAWVLDEFGGWGKVRLYQAPNAALATRYDTNPARHRQRMRIGRAS
ncbi:ATP-binding protein [Mycolicibacterium sp. CBMA 226]|uniref:ATP-binding protein n=1 Tax=Mycolicibacterium sp. CBMA 226 TaxID=2606611 RepID=UPI0012DE37F7|nr:ATP-binding protein [Mycolicibacterium sp. CBMA 226]MUL78779.1 hypothetical protein [Mycolicibacterium sp. CBMA 226]QGW61071.1 hypothetical protein ICEMyc226_00039 [Mycolicibacterium sp.]